MSTRFHFVATGALRPVAIVLLGVGLLFSAGCRPDSVPSEVLIYYANETAPAGQAAENFDTILRWLHTGDHPNHVDTVASFEWDLSTFAGVVDDEVSQLLDQRSDRKASPNVVVFTNRLTRQGKCLLRKHASTSIEEVAFDIPANENYILADNPLSQADSLRSALALVARHFNPQLHKFVLVTKSHGSPKKAITPRLIVRAEETNREELLHVATGEVLPAALPGWAGKLGISKAEYFTILESAGRQDGMRFSLVFMEACNAYTDEIHDQQSKNVDRLLVARGKTHYVNLDYVEILSALNQGCSLSDAMTRHLDSDLLILRRNTTTGF